MRVTALAATGALAATLAACAGSPPPPAWQRNAQDALQAYTAAYLQGNSRVADAEFARARSALSATGRAERVAQAELIRCATRVASLEIGPCEGYEALRQDSGPVEQAYAAYIAGNWQQLDAGLLPPQHRAVVAATASAAGSSAGPGALAAIADPLARLVAAGASLQRGILSPADIALATETAAEQGWRRPLLAWLGVQAQRARQAGAQDELARIERRIALVGGASR